MPIAIDPDNVVTIDDTADFDDAGTYEVIEPTFTPDTVQNGCAQAGRITLQLATYTPSYVYDSVDLGEAGWQNVPGSASGSLGGAVPPNHSAVSTSLAVLTNGVVPLPGGFTAVTLQTVIVPTSYQTVDHPTHSIRACCVTSDLQSLSSFEEAIGPQRPTQTDGLHQF